MRRLESSIENSVVERAKKLGVKFVLKFTPTAQAGWPDRIALIPGGSPVFMEFKRPGEKPRPLQYRRLRQLRDLGYAAEWFDNADDAIRYIVEKMAAPQRADEGGQVPS